VRGRLERGRARLHKRLLRRGIALSATLIALEVSAGNSSATGLPAGFVGATVRAAVAFTARAAGPVGSMASPVTALAEEGLRSVAAARARPLVGLLWAVSVVIAGAGTLAPQTAVSPGPTERDRPGEAPQPDARPKEGQLPRADLFGDPLPEGAIQRL